ncbi:ATP-binding protein [Cellulomonas bogoriensis]|uniref:ATPase n=1 Tax=Cellulomonas bogoriensis 69B4 = DSM 16987 TaxID=1386082 RepID=A0A0A0C3B4_9CELL|nr:DUF234 domain-containing protein [Cellulomonas bogoriensis]KGM13844.1 ATPase [Cellulomonas bogoriensis 69B4 = DSM 16987]
MARFIGRTRELHDLVTVMATVGNGRRDAPGAAVLMRGRRRIGKSRLAEELITRTGAPAVVFQAAKGAPPSRQLGELALAVASSDLPDAATAEGNRPTTLTGALMLLAAALPNDTPSIVVLDEIPWLLESIEGGAGELQRVWDRTLSRKPVLLLLLGSDLAMMEHLTRADQPFFGRGVEMTLSNLTPHDVARMTGLEDPMDVFDSYLITGGQPLVTQEWDHAEPPAAFLARSFESPLSALVASGQRVLDSEFHEGELARQVATAIGGHGERTFSGIQQAAESSGGLHPTSLSRVLDTLTIKRVVGVDLPLSTRPSRHTRYRISDPALRFWLAFVEPALPEVDRGRPDLSIARIERGFASWRGRAIESVVREGVARLLPETPWTSAGEVGGWWPRTNTPEIDLVVTDRRPANVVHLIGTVKWRRSPVNAADVNTLVRDAAHVPGVTPTTPVAAVCPGGVTTDARVAASWTASDLLAAWA